MAMMVVFGLLALALIAGLIGMFGLYDGMYKSMYDEEKNKPPDWSKKKR